MRKLFLFTPLIVLAACGTSNGASRGDGPATTRSFAVGAFDSVELAGSDSVRVVTGAKAGVVASGPAAVLDKLDIRVEGNTLTIGRHRKGWRMGFDKSPGATITVTTPGIKAAAVAGSGDMTIDRAVGDAFAGSLAGSGNLDIANVLVRDIAFEIAGSGDLRAAGKAQAATLEIAGSGNIDADRLVSQTADISIAGSGNARVTAKGSAKISIAGSGDATVKGTGNCTVSKVGSGDGRCEP